LLPFTTEGTTKVRMQERIDIGRMQVDCDKARMLAAQEAPYHRAKSSRASRRGENNAVMEATPTTIPQLTKRAAWQ